MRAMNRKRFEDIVRAFVLATGGRWPEQVPAAELLAAVRQEVSGATLEEIRAAIAWSLRKSSGRAAKLEAMLRRKAMTIFRLNGRFEPIERAFYAALDGRPPELVSIFDLLPAIFEADRLEEMRREK